MLTGMQHFKKILDDLGIESSLDCGTLLKMYRDQSPDYSDCDMSIHQKYAQKLKDNLGAFKKYDFILVNDFGFPVLGPTEFSFLCGSYKFDIFVRFFEDNWSFIVSTYNNKPVVAKAPRKHFDKLVDFILSSDESSQIDRHWKIPKYVKSYLKYYYGNDWKTPNSRWTWDMAPCIDWKWSERYKW